MSRIWQGILTVLVCIIYGPILLVWLIWTSLKCRVTGKCDPLLIV